MKARVQVWMDRDKFKALLALLQNGMPTPGEADRQRIAAMEVYNNDPDGDDVFNALLFDLEQAHMNNANYETEAAVPLHTVDRERLSDEVECPRCGAKPGERCHQVMSEDPRKAGAPRIAHPARFDAAKAR